VDPSALATTTSTTLLEGLRDPSNRTLWAAYVERYRPAMVGTLRRAGLGADDAEDVAQTALLAFSEGFRAGEYERARGRLRDWLFGILRHKLTDWRRRAGRRPAEDAPTAELEGLAAEDELGRLWEEEWRRAVVRACLQEVRDEVAPTTLAAHAIGRLGCFFGGCCYGRPFDGPWAIVYERSLVGAAAVPRHPSPIYESIGLLGLGLAFALVPPRRPGSGHRAALWLGGYCALRAVLELFRGDAVRGVFGGVSTSQWLALLGLAVALGLWRRAGRLLEVP